MINGKTNEIYQLLKEYIVKKSKYNPSVLKNVIDNQYPLVVFENNVKCYFYYKFHHSNSLYNLDHYKTRL